MNKKLIIGIVVGLMMATSAVYFVEMSEELFEEQDMVKGPFFLIVAIAYIPVAVWMLKSPNNSVPHVIAIAGTVGLMALYAVTRTDAGAFALGLEHAGSIGHLGIVSKVAQVGIVVGSILTWSQTRKEPLLHQNTSRVRKQ